MSDVAMDMDALLCEEAELASFSPPAHTPRACARMLAGAARGDASHPRARTPTPPPLELELSGNADDALTPAMRADVVDWTYEVCTHYGLARGTAAAAVAYVDKALRVRAMPREYVLLLASACILLASKMIEPQHVPLDALLHYTGHRYAREELLGMEDVVLRRLAWALHVRTPHALLADVLAALPPRALPAAVAAKLRSVAEFYIDIAVSEMPHDDAKVHALAVAALVCALRQVPRVYAPASVPALVADVGLLPSFARADLSGVDDTVRILDGLFAARLGTPRSNAERVPERSPSPVSVCERMTFDV